MDVTTFFLCGDVMIGRGIDQILPHSTPPRLFEPHVSSAEAYVEMAEATSGPIPRSVSPTYVWGSALPEIERRGPAARIVNLETAVTISDDAWPGKEVLYRTHPRNVSVPRAAGIGCCVLANNHVLDWGPEGLSETLASLHAAGLATAGAGHTAADAKAPAILDVPSGRVLVVAIGSTSSGIPADWAATDERGGVNLVHGWSERAARTVADALAPVRRPGDVVVVSIHWGANWGYGVQERQRRLAHQFIEAGADIVHGHSSHHPRAMEVHRGKLILYGCGDFITDYEGITGHEDFRGDLVLAYFPTLDQMSGRLLSLSMVPFRLRRFQPTPATPQEAGWLATILDRESRTLNVRVSRAADGTLLARWASGLNRC